MTTLQNTTNIFTTEQEAENFMLSYLETHRDFLNIIRQKFFLPKKISRKQKVKLEMVDAETNKRIGQALAEKGQGVVLSTKEEIYSFLASLRTDNVV